MRDVAKVLAGKRDARDSYLVPDKAAENGGKA